MCHSVSVSLSAPEIWLFIILNNQTNHKFLLRVLSFTLIPVNSNLHTVELKLQLSVNGSDLGMHRGNYPGS